MSTMLKLGVLVVCMVQLALGQDFGTDISDRPWMKETNVAIPEDNLIIDLSEKRTILLNCPLKGPAMFATWFKKSNDNKEIELPFLEGRYDYPTMVDITIENLNVEDEGLYICKNGSNERFPVVKRYRLLIVDVIATKPPFKLVEPPVWTVLPAQVSKLGTNRPVILPCKAEKPDTMVRVYRLKDNGEIFKLFKDKAVVIHRPSSEDSGQYMCEAKNSAGTKQFKFFIEIRVDGKFGEWEAWGPCDKECGFGQKARKRSCNNPAPAGGGRFCTGTTIQRSRCRQRSCQAPFLQNFGFKITDKALILDCKARGIPTPEIEWLYNGRRFGLTYDSRNTHFVIPKSRAKSGSYSCKVANTVGQFTMYITIEL